MLSASDSKRLCKGSMLRPRSGKKDLAKCVQISCLMRSRILWLCACRRLTKDNNREEELVDIAPGWGEPHISCVVMLCVMY
jgi:hypothetical protein